MKYMILLIVTIAMISHGCEEKAAIHPDGDFIGNWKLDSWSSTLPDGREVYPYGENAYGRISYHVNGEMIAILMAEDRSKMSTIDVDTRIASEALEAFNSFFSYSGPYEVNRDSSYVVHTVEGCINPNWVGAKQVRHFKFEKDKLILSTPPIKVINTENQATQQVLVWSRID